MNVSEIDFHYWPLPSATNKNRWLCELKLSNVKRQVIVIVLDHSDSCTAPILSHEQLAKLLSPCKRETLVWIYQLSNSAFFDFGNTTVAHMINGSFRWDNLQREVLNRERMARRGSYLAPALTAITERRLAEQVGELSLFVLTDGNLTDCAPLNVPPELSIYGITNVEDIAINQHWQRVLPHARLSQVRDLLLRKTFEALALPFHGACEISLTPSEMMGSCQQLLLQEGRISPLAQNSIAWNLFEKPLYLLLENALDQNPECALAITCRRTNHSTKLNARLSDEQPSSTALAIFEKSLKALPRKQRFLLDLTNGSESLATELAAVQIAKELAVQKKTWLDAQGTLLPWPDAQKRPAFYGPDVRPIFPALLCVMCRDPSGSVVRLQLLGIEKHSPFVVQPADELGQLWGLVEAIRIHYSHDDSRWMLQLGTAKEKELNPSGSQRFNVLITNQTIPEVEFLFSGSLK